MMPRGTPGAEAHIWQTHMAHTFTSLCTLQKPPSFPLNKCSTKDITAEWHNGLGVELPAKLFLLIASQAQPSGQCPAHLEAGTAVHHGIGVRCPLPSADSARSTRGRLGCRHRGHLQPWMHTAKPARGTLKQLQAPMPCHNASNMHPLFNTQTERAQ